MSITKKSDPKFVMAYDRAMLRSAFVSLFWRVIVDQKKKGFTLVALAKKLSTNKAEVSRWFKGDPNWTVNTIASIAHALDLELRVEAVDRKTGHVYRPNSVQYEPSRISSGISSWSLKPQVRVTRIVGSAREATDLPFSRAA